MSNSIFLVEDKDRIKEIIFAKEVADKVLCVSLPRYRSEDKLSFIKSLYNYKKIDCKVFLISLKDFLRNGEENILISKSSLIFEIQGLTHLDINTLYSLNSDTLKDTVIFVERLLEERVSEIELSKIKNIVYKEEFGL